MQLDTPRKVQQLDRSRIAPPEQRVHDALAGSLYQGYAYSYPHKSAYRRFSTPIKLKDIWRDQTQDPINLYLHVPFCEMRCGFCNLFTTANPSEDLSESYLSALARQVSAIGEEVGVFSPRSLTIGGGTPTYLSSQQLAKVFEMLTQQFACNLSAMPTCIETSPMTATPDRLDTLVEHGVNRISIGVQSFSSSEVRSLGRPQKAAHVVSALDHIRKRPFDSLNIDLIYGAAGQTIESWTRSIHDALRWEPEEVFIYPLYVRPLTGLDGRADTWDEQRSMLYRAGREILLSHGYTQHSMRMFVRAQTVSLGSADGEAGQPDENVLGLGCGARSRTQTLHYASDYAVGRAGVRDIINAYCEASVSAHRVAEYGMQLGKDDIMRRAVVRSILTVGGLDLSRFKSQFAISPQDAFAELRELEAVGLLAQRNGKLVPTAEGFAHADIIGPLMYSPHVQHLMDGYELR